MSDDVIVQPKAKRKLIKNMTYDEIMDGLGDKVSPATMKRLLEIGDFSTHNRQFCDKVCKLPGNCKEKNIVLFHKPVDVLIIQNHAYNEVFGRSFKSNEEVEEQVYGILMSMAQEALTQRGVSYHLANVAKCVPPRKTTYTKFKSCSAYLLEEIRRCKPKVIVSFSTEANKVIGGSVSVKEGRGTVFMTDIVGLEPTPVVTTIHPKATTYIRQNSTGAFWGPDYYPVIARDLAKAGAIAKGEVDIKQVLSVRENLDKLVEQGLLRICKTIEECRRNLAILKGLDPKAVISVDIEATGVDPFHAEARMLTIQFAYRDPVTQLVNSFLIPLWHRANTFVNPDEIWPEVVEILEGPNPKNFHNGKFDILYIRVTTGVKVNNFFMDTMLLIHAINSGIKGCYGLKAALWDYCIDLGLGGYEDLLPKLDKPLKGDDDVDADVEQEEGVE